MAENRKNSIKIPRKYQECEVEGEYWMSGYVAKKCAKIDPSLGAYEHNLTKDHAKSKYADLASRGGITRPTKKFLSDVKKMRKMFIKHHPKDSLKKGPGLISDFYEILKTKFSHYHDKVLHLIARLFTRFRVRTINKIEKLKKKKRKSKKKGPKSLRGMKKQAEYSH